MPQAPAYTRTKNFLENNPDRTDHGSINAELDKAALSINALRDNGPIFQPPGKDYFIVTGFDQPVDVGIQVLTLAPLHQLGSGQWEKAKRKAAQQIRDTAAELLNLYAQRALRRGHQFKLSPLDYERFAEGFPFEETPDQKAAIEALTLGDALSAPMALETARNERAATFMDGR